MTGFVNVVLLVSSAAVASYCLWSGLYFLLPFSAASAFTAALLMIREP